VLERTAQRFAERLEADSGRLADAAAQIGAGATEIASLGDAFGQAVQAFGESNAQLGAHLQQLDATLAQSIARSDEQLAYYVAQAREVIDLSLASQQQIVADLQRLAHERAAAGGAAT
jgi:methyl-accepting chemotaxis protein